MRTRTKPPLRVGTRVHHRGCLWNYGYSEDERQATPSWGWATVLSAKPQRDGTVEYEVRKDAPITEGGSTVSWWASYHIDQVDDSALEGTRRGE